MRISNGEATAEVVLENETAVLGGRRVAFGVSRTGERLEAVRIGPDLFPVRVAREGERVLVWCAGKVWEFRRAGRKRAARGEAGGSLAAPMPGRVRKVVASPGDPVARGDVVLILEAMKMEHAIRAPRAGTVSAILHAEGDLVEAGEQLAEIS
jgi:acetyl/propionyl-CoA carboxylase alpha subunit